MVRIFNREPQELRKLIDAEHEKIQSIESEYDAISAECELYRKFGDLFDEFKRVYAERRRRQIAFQRMGLPEDDPMNAKLIGGFEEWGMFARSRDAALLAEKEILTAKAACLQRISEFSEELSKVTKGKVA